MIKSLQQFFNKSLKPAAANEDTLHLAAAALMIELICIDDKRTPAERAKLLHLLETTWHLKPVQTKQLVSLAEAEADSAHDLYQFTRLINDNYSYALKCRVIASLWEIAFADNELNKYEEALIRKIAELLYVEHADFIRSKQTALATHKPA